MTTEHLHIQLWKHSHCICATVIHYHYLETNVIHGTTPHVSIPLGDHVSEVTTVTGEGQAFGSSAPYKMDAKEQ